jgi:uncharacterized repeat protein (TIGR03943 family)
MNQAYSNSTERQNWFKTLLLLMLAVYLFFLIVSGNLGNYINLRFSWLTYVALGLLLLLGGWSLRQLLKRAATPTTHTPLTWNALWILAIPLFLGVVVPSQPLTAAAVNGGISMNAIGSASTDAAYSKPPEERNVLDWLREFNLASSPATLAGLPVDVVGFVYREPDMSAAQFMVSRFTLSCCVADAFAIGLPVFSEQAAELKEGDWVRVRGTLFVGDFRGEATPIIEPTSIEIVTAPQQPYLYP